MEPTEAEKPEKPQKDNHACNIPLVKKFRKGKKSKFKLKLKKPPKVINTSSFNIRTDAFNDFYKEDENGIYDITMKICNRKEQLDRVSLYIHFNSFKYKVM